MSCFYGYKAINATQKTVNNMNNPINNTVFDSRDLIEYLEELEEEIVDYYNDYIDDHNTNVDIEEQMEEISTFDEVDLSLDGFFNRYTEEIEHYENVRDFVDELEGYGDFDYGAEIIHEDHFTDYSKELCEEIDAVSSNLSWYILNHIDWGGVASELKMDYMEVEFEGETYLMRA